MEMQPTTPPIPIGSDALFMDYHLTLIQCLGKLMVRVSFLTKKHYESKTQIENQGRTLQV